MWGLQALLYFSGSHKSNITIHFARLVLEAKLSEDLDFHDELYQTTTRKPVKNSL